MVFPRLRPGRPLSAVGSLVLFTATLAACSRAGAANLPPSAPTVDIVLKEFVIQRPSSIPGGRVVFRVHNAGRFNHVLSLFPWPNNLPPVALQVSGKLPAITLDSVAGTPLQFPGQTDEFAVDLPPGRYALVDLLSDIHGDTDAKKGMATQFTIPGVSHQAPADLGDDDGTTTTISTQGTP